MKSPEAPNQKHSWRKAKLSEWLIAMGFMLSMTPVFLTAIFPLFGRQYPSPMFSPAGALGMVFCGVSAIMINHIAKQKNRESLEQVEVNKRRLLRLLEIFTAADRVGYKAKAFVVLHGGLTVPPQVRLISKHGVREFLTDHGNYKGEVVRVEGHPTSIYRWLLQQDMALITSDLDHGWTPFNLTPR